MCSVRERARWAQRVGKCSSLRMGGRARPRLCILHSHADHDLGVAYLAVARAARLAEDLCIKDCTAHTIAQGLWLQHLAARLGGAQTHARALVSKLTHRPKLLWSASI